MAHFDLDKEINELESKLPDLDNSAIEPIEDKSDTNLTKLQYLKGTKISRVDEENRYESNVVSNFEYFGKYIKFNDNLNFKVPSDNQNILKTYEDCLEILDTLYPLSSLILGLELEIEVDQIGDRVKWYESSENNIECEKLLIEIKYKTLYLITKTARIVNEFLIKPHFTIEEFKNLTKHTLQKEKLILVTKINLGDLKEILEGISLIFPEIKLPDLTLNKTLIANKLFQDSNLTVNSSSRVMDIFYCFCVSKNLSLTEIANNISKVSQTYSKIYKENEKLELVFREIETTLIKDFGIETYKIFSLLVCYQYDNEDKIINGKLTVSGKDLLSYLRRKNNLYRENNIVKRSKLVDNFSWLANQLDLLTIPRLICPKIVPSGKNKQDIVLNNTALIEIGVGYKPTKEGVFDLSNIPDMIITYSIPWFDYFNSKKYLVEYGYTHIEAFSSSGVKSALLHWLNPKLEQNQDGDFKIKTIIDQIGLKDKLEAIYSETDSKKLSNLKLDLYRVLMKALTEIKDIDDPYQWEFKNAPQWLLNETLKKPRGWFDSWLELVIIIKHPKCLIDVGKEFRREKIKEITPEPKPEKIKTTEDLKYVMDKFKISIRDLVKKSENKFTYYKLQKSLKESSLKDSEVRELINYCYRINQSRKK